jgi:hypothetical protein
VKPEDKDMDKGIQRAFRERYPELRFVEREVDVVEKTTRVRSQLPGEVVRRKVVRIMHDGTEGDLWSKLCEHRKETESDGRVTMHHVNCMGVERLRKMVEAVFHGTETTLCIYTTQVLQLMRTSINSQEIGVSVSFKRAAESCTKDKAKIIWHEPKKTIMLRDVDNVVSEEEIREAICAEEGDDIGQIEVRIKKPKQGAKSRKTYAMGTVNTRMAQGAPSDGL